MVLVPYNAVWCRALLYGREPAYMAGMVWCSKAQYGAVQCSMVWYGAGESVGGSGEY